MRMGRAGADATARLEILSAYPGLEARGAVPELVAELAETDFGMAVDFGTEAGLFQQCLDVPVVVCGPGDIVQAHAPDEYLEETQLRHAERFVQRIISWCSNPSPSIAIPDR
jgi:acetylornithine deacetylase